MSRSEDRNEAQRWLDTAADDLPRGESLAAAGYPRPRLFLRSAVRRKGREGRVVSHRGGPWGHSVRRLIEDFP